jgi:hypothetical protein
MPEGGSALLLRVRIVCQAELGGMICAVGGRRQSVIVRSGIAITVCRVRRLHTVRRPEERVIMTETILAIDNGTQSVRALLFDRDGQLLFRSQVKFDPVYHSPLPGYAEQSAEYYWACLVQAVQGSLAARCRPADVIGVTR